MFKSYANVPAFQEEINKLRGRKGVSPTNAASKHGFTVGKIDAHRVYAIYKDGQAVHYSTNRSKIKYWFTARFTNLIWDLG